MSNTFLTHQVSDSTTKVAAGWLFYQAGWKGYRKGYAGIHKNNALVLVNYGAANGMERKTLSKEVQDSVWSKFGILLEAEINIIWVLLCLISIENSIQEEPPTTLSRKYRILLSMIRFIYVFCVQNDLIYTDFLFSKSSIN